MPDRVKLPSPAFVKVTEVPVIAPVIELAPPLVTLKAELLAKVISPAFNTSVVIVKPVNAVPPPSPTAPVKVTSPLPLVAIIKVCAPFTVLPKDTSPLDVVVKVGLAVNVTAPV